MEWLAATQNENSCLVLRFCQRRRASSSMCARTGPLPCPRPGLRQDPHHSLSFPLSHAVTPAARQHNCSSATFSSSSKDVSTPLLSPLRPSRTASDDPSSYDGGLCGDWGSMLRLVSGKHRATNSGRQDAGGGGMRRHVIETALEEPRTCSLS